MASLTVTRSVVTPIPLVVLLSSSDTSEASVPASITIPGNQASASVDISAVDDALVDGSQTVSITAKPTYTNTPVPLPSGSAATTLQILDDESASLSLSLDRTVISESGTVAATVRRNTDLNSPLTVNILSSDLLEAVVPSSITIAAGQETATFTISGVSDGVSDGPQPIIITASAAGFNSGLAALEVTDTDVPDLVIKQLGGVGNTYTRAQSQFSYSVTNSGTSTASGSWKDRIYLSKDAGLDATDTLLGEFSLGSEASPANLLPGLSFNRVVTYYAPAQPGSYYLIAQTDSGQNINEGAGSGESNNITFAPLIITPAYRASVYTDTESILPGESVVLRGQALSNANDSPAGFEFVTIQLENNGTRREVSAFTDANGRFVRQFVPPAGEGGTYSLKAYFPGYAQEDPLPEDSFTLLGMQFEQGDQRLSQLNQRITEGKTFTGSVQLQNLSGIALTGLIPKILGAPNEWNVQLNLNQSSLPGEQEIGIDFSITVPDDRWSYASFAFDVTSAEGLKALLPVRIDVNQLLPKLVADQSSLQSSMLRGGQTLVSFKLANQGVVPSGELELRLPSLPWLKAASPVKISSLGVGESSTVSLLLQPTPDQDLTVYSGSLVVAGAETSLTLPFSFRAVSEAVGGLSLNVVDEYFFFTEGAPTLANATITLLDPFTGNVIFSERDADGVFQKDNLPEGYYKLRVTADNHDTYENNLFIGAGETENISAFLSRQAVRYKWTVTPIKIEDRYTISIESIFETNVPVPTVVIEPSFIDLEQLQVVGQVVQVDVKATNHGLIAAKDLGLNFGSHPFYRFEPLINQIDTLGAKSSITIPVRITRIADFDTLGISSNELQTQSGGSVPCSISASIDYSYECAGETIERDIPLPIFNVEGDCSGTGTPGGGGDGVGGGGSPAGLGGLGGVIGLEEAVR